MKPYVVSIYVYAESEEQVAALESELNAFVREKYNGGVLVTAVKLINALRRFKTNIFVTSFLKQ